MNTRVLLCLTLMAISSSMLVQPASASGKKAIAKAAMARLLARDAARDVATAGNAHAVPASTRVWRYTTAEGARREVREGILPGRHFTPRVTPGRPPGPSTAQQQYGLPQPPQVRMTVQLDKGTTVLRNKALGGQPGRGELVNHDPLPPGAVVRVVRLKPPVN